VRHKTPNRAHVPQMNSSWIEVAAATLGGRGSGSRRASFP